MTETVGNAGEGLRDFGSAAISRTAELGRTGVDLGRRAVDAMRSIDVRDAAAAVRRTVRDGAESARDGIKNGTEWAGSKTHKGAEYARSYVTGDSIAARTIRGAVTYGETATRFQLGVVGGVTREVVGLAGTVSEFGVTAVEMQLSTEARIEYGQKIADGAQDAAAATEQYVSSVVDDPSRIGRDLGSAAGAGERFVDGQIDRYGQAIRDGRGPETIGMDVGIVATYVVPVGGGPVRGTVIAAARGEGEAALRGGVEAVARGAGNAVVRSAEVTAARAEIVATGEARTSSLGRVLGSHSAVEPGPLPDNRAGTFAGGRYSEVQLGENTTLFRAGTVDQPLGQFFTTQPPRSVLQTRIDSAVLPVWPGGATSPLDTAFAINVPQGTSIYVGKVSSQGGFYVGGTEQVVVVKPWTIPGVNVIGSAPLK